MLGITVAGLTVVVPRLAEALINVRIDPGHQRCMEIGGSESRSGKEPEGGALMVVESQGFGTALRPGTPLGVIEFGSG